MCQFSVQKVKGQGQRTLTSSGQRRISIVHVYLCVADHSTASRLRRVRRLQRRLQTSLRLLYCRHLTPSTTGRTTAYMLALGANVFFLIINCTLSAKVCVILAVCSDLLNLVSPQTAWRHRRLALSISHVITTASDVTSRPTWLPVASPASCNYCKARLEGQRFITRWRCL